MSVEFLNKNDLDKIFSMFEQQRKELLEKHKKFGKVKSIIHANNENIKFVAVGNTIYHSNKWKKFPDFLFEFVWRIFGIDWYKNESKKNFEEQNEIVNGGSVKNFV